VDSSRGSGKLFLAVWCLVLLTLGLVFTLFAQLVNVYFTLDVDPLEATASDGVRWVWTASACVTVAVSAVALAIASGSTGMRWMTAITLVIAVVASAAFVVPRDRFTPPPKPNVLPSGYTPCYSGSNTCN
jgi:hypothetical protein